MTCKLLSATNNAAAGGWDFPRAKRLIYARVTFHWQKNLNKCIDSARSYIFYYICLVYMADSVMLLTFLSYWRTLWTAARKQNDNRIITFSGVVCNWFSRRLALIFTHEWIHLAMLIVNIDWYIFNIISRPGAKAIRALQTHFFHIPNTNTY